ncbi:MAG: hypothetical protein ACI4SF_08350 [Oscillospiraceae bacterium]
MNLKICPICRSLYPEDFVKCDRCNEELIDNDIYKKWDDKKRNEYMRKYKPMYETKPSSVTLNKLSVPMQHKTDVVQQQNIPTCPTCGSTKVHPISSGKKAIGFLTVGIFSSSFGKSYECENCKYKW